MKNILRTNFILVLALAGPAHAAIADDFNDGNDSGWTRYDPLASFGLSGNYAFPNGGYQIQAAANPALPQLGPARAGSFRTDESFADFSVSVDVLNWGTTGVQSFGVIGRGQNPGIGTTDGYALSYCPQCGLFLNRFDNEVGTEIGAPASVSLTAGESYRLVFTGVGSTLTGQIFNTTDLNTPLGTVTASDNTYAVGLTGLLVAATFNGATGQAYDLSTVPSATFDNFSATTAPVPVPAAAWLMASGLLALTRFAKPKPTL